MTQLSLLPTPPPVREHRDPLPPWAAVWQRIDTPRRGLFGVIVRRTTYRPPPVREWWLEVDTEDGRPHQHVRVVDSRPHQPTEGEA